MNVCKKNKKEHSSNKIRIKMFAEINLQLRHFIRHL